MARGVLLLGFSVSIPAFFEHEYIISQINTTFNLYYIKLVIQKEREVSLRSLLRRMMRDHDKEKSCI